MKSLPLFLLCVLLTAPLRAAEPPPITGPDEATLQAFFADMDMIYDGDGLLRGDFSGLPLGNGLVGATVKSDGRSLCLQIDRQDAWGEQYDKRRHGKPGDASGTVQRYVFGNVIITPKAAIVDSFTRLDLWNATAHVEVTTGLGRIRMRMFIPPRADAVVVHARGTGGEAELDVRYRPHDHSVHSRSWRREYDTGEGAKYRRLDGVDVCVQPNDFRGERAVAWASTADADVGRWVVAAPSFARSTSGVAGPAAVALVQAVRDADPHKLESEHRKHWHELYRRHFLSIPDKRLETIYWLAIYRLCSQFRPGGPIADNGGLWPDFYYSWRELTCDWNAGSQLPIAMAANLFDRAEPLVRAFNQNVQYLNAHVAGGLAGDRYAVGLPRVVGIDYMPSDAKAFDLEPRHIDDVPLDTRIADGLIEKAIDVPGDGETGMLSGEAPANFTHVLHGYYRYYRSTMDQLAGRRLYMLCKLAMRSWLYLLGEKRDDGRYHLDMMANPEHGHGPDGPYGLSAIQWLCRTIMELDDRWHLNDPERARWQDIRDNLAPYPTHPEQGYVRGPGITHPSNKFYHTSHLYMLAPYRLVLGETEEERALIRRSLESYGVRTSMDAAPNAATWCMLGEGDIARDWLHKTSLGMWASHGLLEKPLIVGESIQNFVLQSFGGVISVFPAMPDDWPDAVFHDMRAEGAFDVSAAYRDGQTRWIRIRSDSGEPCSVRHRLAGPIEAMGARPFKLTEHDDGTLSIDLKKGETVLLTAAGSQIDTRIAPVPGDGWTGWAPRCDPKADPARWGRARLLAQADAAAHLASAGDPRDHAAIQAISDALRLDPGIATLALRDALLGHLQQRRLKKHVAMAVTRALFAWPGDEAVREALRDALLARNAVLDDQVFCFVVAPMTGEARAQFLADVLPLASGRLMAEAVAVAVQEDYGDLLERTATAVDGRQLADLLGSLARVSARVGNEDMRPLTARLLGEQLKTTPEEDQGLCRTLVQGLALLGADAMPYRDILEQVAVQAESGGNSLLARECRQALAHLAAMAEPDEAP